MHQINHISSKHGICNSKSIRLLLYCVYEASIITVSLIIIQLKQTTQFLKECHSIWFQKDYCVNEGMNYTKKLNVYIPRPYKHDHNKLGQYYMHSYKREQVSYIIITFPNIIVALDKNTTKKKECLHNHRKS